MKTERPPSADDWEEFDVGTVVEWVVDCAGAQDGEAVITLFLSQNLLSELTNGDVYAGERHTYAVEASPVGELDATVPGWRDALCRGGGEKLERFIRLSEADPTVHYAASPDALRPVGYVRRGEVTVNNRGESA